MFSCFLFSSRRRHTRCALVTGVQTCALPIFDATTRLVPVIARIDNRDGLWRIGETVTAAVLLPGANAGDNAISVPSIAVQTVEIGRASCRERVCQYV